MSILSNRLKYMLSPQADIYKQMSEIVSGWVGDVGCGLGFGSNLLLPKARLVCGYDIDIDYLKFAEWCFPNVRFKQHNIVQSPLPYVYDYITMIDIIEHIEEDKTAIQNVFKCLKPNGSLILSTPNSVSRYRKSDNHIREYTPQTLNELLSTTFNSVKLMSYNWTSINSGYENPIIAWCRKDGK